MSDETHGHRWVLIEQSVELGWRIWVYECETCGAICREQVVA